MQKSEIISLIDAYLIKKQAQRCTAHIMIDVHMSQGGFGVPQFNILQPASMKVLANGLRFDMES